jgi:hypothetical protein
MTINQLGAKLHDMYHSAPRGEQVTMIHLFGVLYSDDIRKYSIKDIVLQAGIHSTYSTEVSKAVNLAHYVQVKPEYERMKS